jgi:cytochrome P450
MFDLINLGLQTLLIAGTDTIYKTVTEAIYEVVRNPHIHKRALEELDTVVGATSRLVEDADMPQLPFLHNIVKETLRVHPPAPTLPPHRNFEPCEVEGYFIPANCSIVINLPPIMHDASFWDNPSEFNPNRFNDMVCSGY